MLVNLNLFHQSPVISPRLPKVEPMDFTFELITYRKTFKSGFLSQLAVLKTSAINSKLQDKQVLAPIERASHESEEGFKTVARLLDLQDDYQFKLYLHATFDKKICKGKYFSFKVILGQMSDLVYPTNEVAEVEVVVYNNEQMIISKNMKGHDILRGNYKQNMHYFKPESKHVAYFRIQITEVSSHFINKTVNLLIRAKNNGFLIKTGWKIQPIIIEGLTIKAKKASLSNL